MRIVSWNMNRRSAASHEKAWAYLQHDLKADVALVQEAVPPDRFDPKAYRPIDEKQYRWGSAVVSLSSGFIVRPRKRINLADCYLTPVAAGELPDSHPGACAVADLLNSKGAVQFTAVSLYGQWEMAPGGKNMYACARLHRMLSDLTGVLATARRHPVVLAGDFNVTSQFPSARPTQAQKDAAAGAAAAFERIEAWGLVDCISKTRATRARLENCACLDGDSCSHTRTFRSKNKASSSPTQLDYAFVSGSFATRPFECQVVDDDAAWKFSDHCPILLEL